MRTMNTEIKLGSKAHLSTSNPRQKRRLEDPEAFRQNWDATFGQLCDKCGHKHGRHSLCQKGGTA